jgi:hypothetical protein
MMFTTRAAGEKTQSTPLAPSHETKHIYCKLRLGIFLPFNENLKGSEGHVVFIVLSIFRGGWFMY